MRLEKRLSLNPSWRIRREGRERKDAAWLTFGGKTGLPSEGERGNRTVSQTGAKGDPERT